jgi:nucleotide-binding universal stress UspA family protein
VQRVAKELGPTAAWEVLHGEDPAEEIVRFAHDRRAGLIAMTTTPRHRIGPDIAGGVALHVIRHAPCPVLAMGRVDR